MTGIFSDYAKYYNLIYKDKPYKKEADFVYNWANKPKTIFEIGCGTGGHAKYWCDKAKIVGVDDSAGMLKNAYRHKNIRYFNSQIDKFSNIKFDCVMALFNVMGYYLLENCLSDLPLKKGGYFIFDIWDAAKFDNDPPQLKLNNFYYDTYRATIPQRLTKRLIQIDFIIVEDTTIKAFERHFVEGYFKKDIEDLCRKHNYKIIGVKPTKTWACWYKIMKI